MKVTKAHIYRPPRSLSIPRPVIKGFYNQWLMEPGEKVEAIGFPLLPRPESEEFWEMARKAKRPFVKINVREV